MISYASSGVKEIHYMIDGMENVVSADSVAFTITGEDGEYTIEYWAIDNIGNEEEHKIIMVYLDNTPPVSQLTIGEPRYSDNPTYITSHTDLTLTITDEGCGVDTGYWWCDASQKRIYVAETTFTLAEWGEGLHTLYYYGVDKLGNREPTKEKSLAVDDTPPVSELINGTPSYSYGDSTIITSHTDFTLRAEDPLSADVASGVQKIVYRVDSMPWQEIPDTHFVFTLEDWGLQGQDGRHTISHYAVDNVENKEDVKSHVFILDDTPPECFIISPTESCMVNQNVPVYGRVRDAHFAWWKLEYGEGISPSDWITISEGQKQMIDTILGWFNAKDLSDGIYVLRLTAQDVVLNTSEFRRIIFRCEPQFDLAITGLHKPEGVHILPDGNSWIYVADRNNKRIAYFDYWGNFVGEITGLHHPNAVRFNGEIIYTTLWWGHTHLTVLGFDLSGNEVYSATGLNHPKGINFYGDYIVVAERNWDRLTFLDDSANIVFTIPAHKCEGIGVDSPYIFTCLVCSGKVVKYYVNLFDTAFRVMEIENFDYPADVEISRHKNIWICERNADRIVMCDRFGNRLLIFGEFGKEPGRFNKPCGISLCYEGDVVKEIYVADRNNDRVQRFKLPEFGAVKMPISIFTADEPLNVEVASYPNPFNPLRNTVKIAVKVNKPAEVKVKIYTLAGNLIWSEEIPVLSGRLDITWDGRNFAGDIVLNGVYICKVIAKTEEESAESIWKIAVIK